MPGRVKVRILSARDLPIMDRASELTDAFVEVRFGTEVFKTEVCKKSLHPQWNSEWFKFEVDDEVLQDEPLDLRVLDYDTYSAHDTIGKVYIDLNPLLTRESPNVISGWYPIYDTMHGLRGELNVQVRVELFSDFNRFRQSSCGIQFFCTCAVPTGWRVQYIFGFIEELVVNDDPEYQWIEKIRTPRASNEARQRLFSKLSGTLQRKLGVKVMEMGGNAVLGYFQNFDLEGESGIVVRAIGTAVAIVKVQMGQQSPAIIPPSLSPAKDMRRHTVSLHHHHHHLSKHRDRSSLPHPPLTRQMSSPNPSPSTSPLSPKVYSSPRRASLGYNYTPPPSAPPIVHGATNGSNPSLFTFPSSSTFPEEQVLSSSSSSPTPQPQQQQLQQQQQQRQPSPDVANIPTTTATTSSSTSPSVSPSYQQLSQSQRHSTSPVRILSSSEANRRLSDSEISSPPKGPGVQINPNPGPRQNYSKTSVLQQSIDLLEYPFFTMRSFPAGFIVSLGGVVSARSVKLLDKIHNPEEPETRDAWWSEVRIEIKSHAAKLGCHAVLGYQEQTTICDEVIVLSAMGTAAKINLAFDSMRIPAAPVVPTAAPPGGATDKTSPGQGEKQTDKEKHLFVDIGLANQAQLKSFSSVDGHEDANTRCSLCHIPYNTSSLPFEIQISKCAICKRKNVPEVLFTTVDPPADMPIWSKGCLIQARICRAKNKNKSSEQSAREVSDILPFLEYEMHNQLINKLKIRGLNCLFGLKIQVCVGENMIIAVATSTGAYLGPLPAPPQPKISTEVATEEESQGLITLQRRINHTVQMHRDRLGSEIGTEPVKKQPRNSKDRQPEHSPHSGATDEETDDDDEGNFFLEATKDKNTFVLVIDDLKDDTVSMILHDLIPPEGFDICNTQTPPGIPVERITANLQMFTQMIRVRYQPTANSSLEFSTLFNNILRRLCFKLRHFRPCCLADICFNVDVPDEDEINIAVTGCCLGLQDSTSQPSSASTSYTRLLSRVIDTGKPSSAPVPSTNQTEDMMFHMEGVGDQAPPPSAQSMPPRVSSTASQLGRSLKQIKDAAKPKFPPPMGIELTPLNIIYNGRIERYLGYYNFFFIRESTAVKECGGVGGFMQSFVLEVKAIVRAHVAALGGNALVAYNMSQFVLENNPHKNQGQCLINVSGDVVVVGHDGDDVFTETPLMVPASAS